MPASTQTGERDGVATATLAAGELDATFATRAGTVCCSLRHRGDELLGQRRALAGYAATGSIMGIPLLHPWANRLAAQPRSSSGSCTNRAPVIDSITSRTGSPCAPTRPHHADARTQRASTPRLTGDPPQPGA
jgi:hypothetical protein